MPWAGVNWPPSVPYDSDITVVMTDETFASSLDKPNAAASW